MAAASGGVRIGVAGAGYVAGRHVAALSRVPHAEVVAVADPQVGRADALAGRCGATPYADWATMLDAAELDALWICVPPSAHGDLERAALDRRLPMLVEKPLAADLATAEALAAGVAEAGVVAVAGYHWRWLDTVERARDLLRATPARLAVGTWLDKAPGPPWWGWTAESGGQLVEQATHLVDLARWLVGEVEDVQAVGARSGEGPGDVLDVHAATLRFASGAVGSLSSTCLLRRPWRIGLELLAPGLALELTETGLVLDDGSGDGPVRTAAAVDPTLRQDADLVAAVRGEPAELRAPYADALRSHRVAVAIAAAAAGAA